MTNKSLLSRYRDAVLSEQLQHLTSLSAREGARMRAIVRERKRIESEILTRMERVK